MRIMLSISPRNDEILHIRKTLENLGHEVRLFGLVHVFEQHYWRRKMVPWREGRAQKQYEKDCRRECLDLLHSWRPNQMLFINLPDQLFSYEEMHSVCREAHKMNCHVCTWMIDLCARDDETKQFCGLFDQVYSYEKADVQWLSGSGVPAHFLPVGYAEAYGIVEPVNPERDIVFIGTPYHSRLHLLQRVAQESRRQGWVFQAIGPFWEKRHPWKPLLGRFRYPQLYSYVDNRKISPEEAAKIYAGSRICLNFHLAAAASCNPRTYEILAAGGFQVIDKRQNYDILEPGKDIVAFDDVDDLLKKIAYYLNNDEQRHVIAQAGRAKILGKRSLRTALKEVLGEARL